MLNRRFALMCALVLAPCGAASAQDNEILTELYGAGVHAYHAGDYKAAHSDLTSVIERGTSDPRAYYFRAIAYLKLGRPDEAQADMEEGAKLESADVDGAFNVGRALERVQGRDRLTLEKYRVKARLVAHERQQQADRQKYEASKSDEKRALRDRVDVPLDGGPATVGPRTPAETVTPATAETPVEEPVKSPAANADPFGDEPAAEKPATTPAAEADPFGEAAPADAPADDAPAADADPFGNAPADEPEMKKEDAPAEEDPFGDAPAEKPADEPAADADPFGDAPADEPEMKKEDAPAGDDPFDDAPAADAPAEKPADEPAADADPFGDAPADEPEMKKEDAPAEEDPFAADAPATEEKPAEDDPFATDAGDEKPADEPAAEDDPFE